MNTSDYLAFYSKKLDYDDTGSSIELVCIKCFDRIKCKMFRLSTIIRVNRAVSHLEIISSDDSWRYSVQAWAHLDIRSSLPSHQHP